MQQFDLFPEQLRLSKLSPIQLFRERLFNLSIDHESKIIGVAPGQSYMVSFTMMKRRDKDLIMIGISSDPSIKPKIIIFRNNHKKYDQLIDFQYLMDNIHNIYRTLTI